MNEYLKLYNTKQLAVDDTTVVAPSVVFCKENSQTLIGGSGVGINEPISIVSDGTGKLRFRIPDYLVFTSLYDNGGISLSNFDGNEPNIEYKKNNDEWVEWDYENISLAYGDVVKFRGENENGFSSSLMKYSRFVLNGSFKVSGNIMSLIDGIGDTTIIPSNNCFCKLFEYCSNIVSAPKLPAVSLGQSCYEGMFKNCVSLVYAPELPATALSGGCYRYMFSRCMALINAPALPITTLSNNCYGSMFEYCVSLTKAPELLATNLQYGCYVEMFYNCFNLNHVKCLAEFESYDGYTNNWLNGVAQKGTFVKSSDMGNWPEGTDGIPYNWEIQNE